MNAKKQRQKHVPQRTCVVCRTKTDKRQLARLVATPDEGVIIDPTGKRNGRGAYLCHNPTCWEKALKDALLNRALQVQLTDAEKQALAAQQPALQA